MLRGAANLTAGPGGRASGRTDRPPGAVEVADNPPDVVLVRDSKDRLGGTLTVPPVAWHTFVAGLPDFRR